MTITVEDLDKTVVAQWGTDGSIQAVGKLVGIRHELTAYIEKPDGEIVSWTASLCHVATAEEALQGEGPQFKHDCDLCKFLGRDEWDNTPYDLYFCSKRGPILVARYGNDGPDYVSGLNLKLGPLQAAERRAKKAGYLK